MNLFFNAETKSLRGGWRLLIYLTLLVLPQLVTSIYASRTPQNEDFGVPVAADTIVFYCVALTWVLFVSWICLLFLDRLQLSSLGILPRPGCIREITGGFGVSILMITSVVLIQVLSGGSTMGVSDAGFAVTLAQVSGALPVFAIAASFEEVLFRGYPLQTLMRSLPAVAAIIVSAALFSLAHSRNPSQTVLAPINTFLAGVWLGVAYFKTRSLWFPTGLHIGWNWAMGALYGLPVSGLHVPQQSILAIRSTSRVWLTGGGYGPEGGAAATIVLIAATLIMLKWNARSTPRR